MTQSPPKQPPTPAGAPPEAQVIELHAPELYHHDGVAEPVDGFDAITEEHLAFYREHGYLAVENAFTPEETEAALQGMMDLIMGRHADFQGIHFEAAAADRLDQLTVDERQDAVRKLNTFLDHEPRLNALAQHPKLLGVLRHLMGGQEPNLFQDMGLIKPPKIGREKPWHQDCAYFNLAPGTPVVGVWIAFDAATIDNGCMHLLDGAHRGGPILHWKRRDWQICDKDIFQKHGQSYPVIAAPLKPGGLLLFDGMLPHGTPHNNSSQRRRAVQYHYRPAEVQQTSTEARLAIFGAEGKDVEC